MIYSPDDLTMMLARSGAAIHQVDGEELYCRIKGLAVEPDEFGRVMSERQELSHITGATYRRSARHRSVVDGVQWEIVHVRNKISGLVVWTMERYTS